ncbi:30S ribosomal protein S15 [Planctomycetales bacterium ZRK34]|nr:30S ribosomal protein S15 [Planctomycetales bacterium ZRK34]
MSLTAEQKSTIIKDFATGESDTGSPQVQIALLTQRINDLTEHMREHKHDYASRRGLIILVGQRNRLLRYLQRTNRQAYLDLIGRLGLRK